ncbi:MAG: allophanate hydrolase subunit 1 [Firmicutes bacterium]|nr:carboxyltransferase domain-containing protein [Alicyclobacillaceae bacterium]MCL6497513.1 allophanate hydrolase subunit 1 [Bacillota bacterium]
MAYGPEAWLWEWEAPSPVLTRLLWRVWRQWQATPPLGVRDLMLGQASLVAMVGPERSPQAWERWAHHMGQWLVRAAQPDEEEPSGRRWEIPVVYDGPDLAAVAAATGLAPEAVVEIHAGREYRVGWMGFLPGFAYLVDLDPRLVLPRRPAARPRVAAGAVAIAEGMTAIYPVASPGGWHWIGRALVPVVPEIGGARGVAFAPGDRVRLRPVPA